MEDSIKKLKNQIIYQLKNSDWSPSYHGFKNEYFTFENNGDDWWIKISLNKNQLAKEIEVSDIMSQLYFKLLKIFYVNRSLKDHEKRIRIKQISYLSDEFFKYNKSLDRDSKIDDILNK
jgi:hypothetical protein